MTTPPYVDLIRRAAEDVRVAHILVIDDDELVAKTIVALLESAAHTVDVATDGRNALKAYRPGAYDLVVTDIFMPEVEGLETIREIRKVDRKVPIIAMSGGPRATIMSGAMSTMDHLEVAQLLGRPAPSASRSPAPRSFPWSTSASRPRPRCRPVRSIRVPRPIPRPPPRTACGPVARRFRRLR